MKEIEKNGKMIKMIEPEDLVDISYAHGEDGIRENIKKLFHLTFESKGNFKIAEIYKEAIPLQYKALENEFGKDYVDFLKEVFEKYQREGKIEFSIDTRQVLNKYDEVISYIEHLKKYNIHHITYKQDNSIVAKDRKKALHIIQENIGSINIGEGEKITTTVPQYEINLFYDIENTNE